MYSIHEIIEQAIQTEKLGYRYYTTLAKKFETNEPIRNLFSTLAQMERKHETTYQDLKSRTESIDVENQGEVANYLRAIVESEFFLGSDKSLLSMEHIQTVDEAIRFAIRFEKESILYFLGLKNLVNDKDTVETIIYEEKSHIVWLSRFKETL
jgi:rubrerythrin